MRNAQKTQAQILKRRIQKALARRKIVWFGQYVMPKLRIARHHWWMGEMLDAVMERDIRFMHIAMPPRHSKSTFASILYPALALGRFPHRQIIHMSYNAALSNDFSRQVRAMIRDNPRYRELFPHITLDPDRARVDDWKIAKYGGGFFSVGVGGGITGHGADDMIIDDPVKEGDERSPTTLKQMFEWYASAARTRLQPGGGILFPMTRWSPMDLAGRVLDLARKDEMADQWVELKLQAIAGENDPLGRLPGEPLWADQFSLSDLLAMQSLNSDYFDALYQQTPVLAKRSLFREEYFTRATLARSGKVTWAIDLAITDDEAADFTVFTPFQRYGEDDKQIYVDEPIRFQAEYPDARDALIKLVDETNDDIVMPKQTYELVAMQELRRERPGALHRFKQVSMPHDKRARATAFASHASVGRVTVNTSRGCDYWVSEHVEFGVADHDDCVDTSSVASHHWGLSDLFSMVMRDPEAERELLDEIKRRRGISDDVLFQSVGGY